MERRKLAESCLPFALFFLASACGAPQAPPPAPLAAAGEQQPLAHDTLLEPLSSTRGRILLNGQWRFEPVLDKGQREPKGNWGSILVPGSFRRTVNKGAGWVLEQHQMLPGVVETHPAWAGYDDTVVDRAFYERTFEIPESLRGRAVEIDFGRVETDAVVFVNGARVGEVAHPFGSVEVTDQVRVGDNTLRVELVSQSQAKLTARLMGTGEEKAEAVDLVVKGLTDDVTLTSRPRGPHVSDVFVKTSVRERRVVLDVEVRDVEQAGRIELTANMLNGASSEATFTAAVDVKAQTAQRFEVAFPWENPRLWDLDEPHLYTLRLRAVGAGIDDDYAQAFGFREFWIDGRDFWLNGTRFKPRPAMFDSDFTWIPVNGSVPVIDRMIGAYRGAGFNTIQAWPSDHFERGTFHFRSLWYERCDKAGMPIYGVARSMGKSVMDPAQGWRFVWKDAGMSERYREQMEAELRRVRNHPSVLMWGTSANAFGQPQDQNPRNIGQRWAGADRQNDWKKRLLEAGEEGVSFIKAFDPTRPVYTHAGAVGDCHTTNHYLNLLPLQEREEWLTDYAQHGEVPFFPVEFGLPLQYSYSRARRSYDDPMVHEPWLTEFAATYFGNRAFTNEEPAYRKLVRDRYQGGLRWQNWQTAVEINQGENSVRLLELFIRNTWRSWRTTGATGGMIPWNLETMVFQPPPGQTPSTEMAFVPGQRGAYFPKLSHKQLYFLGEQGGWAALPSGKALFENNEATLAYIAGPEGALTAKDSRFVAGAKLARGAALHNDTRRTQAYELVWRAELHGKPFASGKRRGKLEPGAIELVPIDATVPAVADKTEGSLTLTAKIGDRAHEDRVPIRVFPKARPLARTLLLADPVGKTRSMLDALGAKVNSWNGKPSSELVVIGRQAIERDHSLLLKARAHVEAGGRALILQHSPEFMRDSWGFRVGRFPARRVFSIDPAHPVLAGLDDQDLVDWNGEGTLIEARPEASRTSDKYPAYGWHWGNRGSVSSAPIEKPHRSSWRPLLETEFDLAYSPLLEMEYGRGRIVLCTLDLEDKIALDPAAALLARSIVLYAAEAPLAPKTTVVDYLGGKSGRAVLDATGVSYRPSMALPVDGIAVIGSDAGVDQKALAAFVARGGKALVLLREEARGMLGVELQKNEAFRGSLSVPRWPEARGLSPSDLRLKVDLPWPLIKGGAEVGADGLLGRVTQGTGRALFTTLSPLDLDAENKSYLRLTRWRQTRALAQLLANLGATFQADHDFFRAEAGGGSIDLSGNWRAAVTVSKKPGTGAIPDPGISAQARALVLERADEKQMKLVKMPSHLSDLGDVDGEAVLRYTFVAPAHWAGKPITLLLGAIDDFDQTYVNGEQVGATDAQTQDAWSKQRGYTVPGRLVRAGKNVIAIRIWDSMGGGGITAAEGAFLVKLPSESKLYSSDYRADQEFGDEPYRYYRW
jgi:beta-galactosidase